MSIKLPKDATEFARAALALDTEFTRFERLAAELERVSLDNESGMTRAGQLLAELGVCRQRFEPVSQELARTMEAARAKTAAAAELVARREEQVQERLHVMDGLHARFKTLGDMVRQVTDLVGKIRQGPGPLSAEERLVLTASLPELDAQLARLIDEARRLMEDARAANLKALVSNADSLRQSLQTARHRFGQLAVDEATPPQVIH